MSRFLSNLMARSFADVPAIQPRLPTLFEPGGAGPLAESQAFSETLVENQTPHTTKDIAPPAQRISKPSNGAVAGTSPSQARLSSSDRNSETETANVPTSEGNLERETANVPTLHSVDRHSRVSRTQVTKRIPDLTRVAGGQTFRQRFEQTSATSAPTINVTIGRVEVRAIHSPAPVRKQSKPAAPKLSLEDYLKKREGGAR